MSFAGSGHPHYRQPNTQRYHYTLEHIQYVSKVEQIFRSSIEIRTSPRHAESLLSRTSTLALSCASGMNKQTTYAGTWTTGGLRYNRTRKEGCAFQQDRGQRGQIDHPNKDDSQGSCLVWTVSCSHCRDTIDTLTEIVVRRKNFSNPPRVCRLSRPNIDSERRRADAARRGTLQNTRELLLHTFSSAHHPDARYRSRVSSNILSRCIGRPHRWNV